MDIANNFSLLSYGDFFSDAIGKTFSIDSDNSPALEQISNWFNDGLLHGGVHKKSLLVLGNTRTGKSALMKCLDKLFRELDRGSKRFFYTSSFELDLMVAEKGVAAISDFTVKSYERELIPNTIPSQYRYVKKSPITICIDELGEELPEVNYMGTKYNLVRNILKPRLDLGLPTHLVSNLSEKELVSKYGDKIMCRIYEQSLVVHLIGKNRGL
jgi:hypothetical protein